MHTCAINTATFAAPKPSPRCDAFRMKLFFTPVLMHWKELVPGFWTTLTIAIAAIVLSLIGGLLLALARESHRRTVRWLSVAYMDLFRNTPFVVQLFFFYYGLPELGIRIDALTTGIVALALTTSTNTAEAIRAGIASIQGGILEAARASGLSHLQTLRAIVLPLAFPLRHPAARQHLRQPGADHLGRVHHHGRRPDERRREPRLGDVSAL